MARTRNAAHRFHQDDGVVLGRDGQPLAATPGAPALAYELDEPTPLDRQGNFVSPAASLITQPRNLSGGTVLRGPGAEPVPVMGAIVGYRADAKSWSRNMEAYELARLLDMAFRNPGELGEGLAIDVTVDEFNVMEGNLRRHFMPVRG